MKAAPTDHAVIFDSDKTPVGVSFPPVFNVAVPFIDRHVAEGRGGRPALRTEEGDVTYQELADNVSRCGNALLDLGLKRGERLLMAVRDTPMFFYTFWGAVKAGIIPIAVNTLLKSPDYRYLIDDSQCSATIHSTALTREVRAGHEDAAGKSRHILSVDELKALMAKQPATLVPAPTAPDEDCFWLYSSGSTGNPKGVVHRHRDMVVTSYRYGQGIVGIREDDIVFCASKLFFSYGFGGGMTFPLWAGAVTVLNKQRPSAEMSLDMIEQYRPTVFFGVPTLYGQQIAAMEEKKRDLSSLRAAASAGEALPAHIFRTWKHMTGISILDGIGSTEALHIFVSNRHDDIRPGTSGRPVPGYEVKIVNEEGEEVPRGEVGLLWVKGDSTARCYWNNPEKTAEYMRGEWLNTGDMYCIDEAGYYVNAGRGDDMLKVGGMWCSPLEIEARLIEHPKVREAAVVGQEDEEALVKPAAYVVLKRPADAGDETAEELKQYCKSGLAGYMYPRWIYFIDDLPKTVTGKIQRFRLRQAEGRQDPLASESR